MEFCPEALVFDMFGTVFDWRSTVEQHLQQSFQKKLKAPTTIPFAVLKTAQTIATKPEFWPEFAQEWRNSYMRFVNSFINDNAKYMRIDIHHFKSLLQLLQTHGLEDFYTAEEAWSISRIWHFLKAWDDSASGMRALRNLTTVSSLSNGDINLLNDLSKTSGVEFDLLLSSELFQSYKPNPKVYIGACELLGFGLEKPAILRGNDRQGAMTDEEKQALRGKVAMVAAHLTDLKAARKCGLKTIYVERAGEEKEDFKEREKKAGWVDMWVGIDEGGFEEIARRLGKLPKAMI